jgi:hypothetical protein
VEFLVGLLVVIIILGALAGGQSFGGTISKGIGCLFVIILALIILAVLP